MCVGQGYVGVGGVYEQARSLRRDRLLFSKASGVPLALLFGGNLLLGVRKADGVAVLGKVFACGLWPMGVDVDGYMAVLKGDSLGLSLASECV